MGRLPGSVKVPKARPWGLWSTANFTILVMVSALIVQTGVVLAFVAVATAGNPELDFEDFLLSLSDNGLYTALAGIVSAAACTPLVLLFARLRKGYPVKEYLGFRMVAKSEFVKWLLIIGAIIAIGDTAAYFLNRPVVPEVVVESYKTADFLPVLFLALMVAAPVFEEVVFRGFMFQGIRYSDLGPVGAIVITAFSWSILHLQYDAYNILFIFVMGLALGLARLKTNSTYVTIALHSLVNLVATVETMLIVHVFS